MLNRLKGARRRALRAVDYHAGAKIRWRWLRRAMPAVLEDRPHHVLDAGSGDGTHAFRFARRYPQATFHGVELDGAHVAACQARLRQEALPNLTFAQGDLTQPLGEALYDLVYCVDVLEHIPDDEVALGHMVRALRPGGRLLIHTPLTPQRHWLRRFDLDQAPRDDHAREGYGEAELKAKVQDAGLVLMEVCYTHGRWGTLAWELWKMARWHLLAKVLVWPLVMFFIGIETTLPLTWGNCIMLQANKPAAGQ